VGSAQAHVYEGRDGDQGESAGCMVQQVHAFVDGVEDNGTVPESQDTRDDPYAVEVGCMGSLSEVVAVVVVVVAEEDIWQGFAERIGTQRTRLEYQDR